MRLVGVILLIIAGACSAGTVGPVAPPLPFSPPLRYMLLSGSFLQDDCPICGRPTVQEPMRGTFDLRLIESHVLFSRYRMENVSFTAGSSGAYTVTGQGDFQIGGEVAVTQKMSMNVDINNGFIITAATLKNDPVPPPRSFPMMDATVVQTNGTQTMVYTLRLTAAPVQDLWFSTGTFFTAGAGAEPGQYMMGGDLLSLSGHRVKTNAQFYGSIGATPPGPDLGLDAVSVLPGGEIAFSLDIGFPMTNVGPVYPGDLLSTKGRIIRRNMELLAAFRIMPVAPDPGLDAVLVLDSGEILFSIESDVFSESLGSTLHRGDLLSSTGSIVRPYSKLYEKFHPSSPPADYGLDSLYRWPGGEIWFSPEFAFTDDQLGPITPGDLLSDQGYIVFRNSELVAPFSPVQTTADFGLDALFVVTDLTPPPDAPPQILISRKNGTPGITLNWQSSARVFQVERVSDLKLPFAPVSPVIPDLSWSDPFEGTRAFYRLRQW